MILSTGRDIYAHLEIFGIDPDGEVYGGYDNRLWPDGSWDYDPNDPTHTPDEKPWTPEERREVALAMIERWSKFGGLLPPR